MTTNELFWENYRVLKALESTVDNQNQCDYPTQRRLRSHAKLEYTQFLQMEEKKAHRFVMDGLSLMPIQELPRECRERIEVRAAAGRILACVNRLFATEIRTLLHLDTECLTRCPWMIRKHEIVSISVSSFYTVIVTNWGVSTCGGGPWYDDGDEDDMMGSRGHLGHGLSDVVDETDLSHNIPRPRQIYDYYYDRVDAAAMRLSLSILKHRPNIVGASAGYDHTLLWDDNGRLYSMGMAHPEKKTSVAKWPYLHTTSAVPRRFPIETFDHATVTGASAGFQFSFVWTASGLVYCFGEGVRLGLDISTRLPQRLPLSNKYKVNGVSAGRSHALLWTKDGIIFSIGRGLNGKLGHGDECDKTHVTCIAAMKKKRVAGAAAGRDHSLVYTDDGHVYSFGSNAHGQLGHYQGVALAPHRIKGELAKKKVVCVAAGLQHSLVVTNDGLILSFGYGSFGQHGHDTTCDEVVPRIVDVVDSDTRKDARIIGVAGGSEHSFIWSSKSIYSFGSGNSFEGAGRLGLGINPHGIDEDDVYCDLVDTPTQIDLYY